MIHRQLRDHEYWADAYRLKAWLTILFMACYRPLRTIWHGQRVTIPRGSFLTTSAILAAEIGRSKSWVKRFLRDAEREGEIKWARQPGHSWSKITVVRYDDYQPCPRDAGPSKGPFVAHSWPFAGPQKKEVRVREEPYTTNQADHEGRVSTGYPQEAVGRIFEAFQEATGTIRSPSPKEREHIREVVAANDGDWHPLVEWVRDVTRAAVSDGQQIRTVSYALRAWTNRRESDSRGPAQQRPQPAYHKSAQRHHRDRDADESKHGAEHARSILERLGIRRKED